MDNKIELLAATSQTVPKVLEKKREGIHPSLLM
jgi:hypothetical protein